MEGEDEIPIECKILLKPDEDRNCTDMCCLIIGVLFTIVLVVIGFSVYNYCKQSLIQKRT